MDLLVLLGVIAIVLIISIYVTTVTQRKRAKKLKEFADRLTAGRFVHSNQSLFAFGNATVQGRLDGWAIELHAESLPAQNQVVVLSYRVQVPHATGDFEIRPAHTMRRIGRWLGLAASERTGDVWVDDKYMLGGSGPELGRLFQSGELERSVDSLFTIGFDGVSLKDGNLKVSRRLTKDDQLGARNIEAVFLRLIAVARICQRRKVQVKIGSKPTTRFGWTGDTRGIRCPFCRDSVEPEQSDLSACTECRTLHHAACLAEAGGCTIFGCRGRRRQRA